MPAPLRPPGSGLIIGPLRPPVSGFYGRGPSGPGGGRRDVGPACAGPHFSPNPPPPPFPLGKGERQAQAPNGGTRCGAGSECRQGKAPLASLAPAGVRGPTRPPDPLGARRAPAGRARGVASAFRPPPGPPIIAPGASPAPAGPLRCAPARGVDARALPWGCPGGGLGGLAPRSLRELVLGVFLVSRRSVVFARRLRRSALVRRLSRRSRSVWVCCPPSRREAAGLLPF